MVEITTRQRVLNKSAELFNCYGMDAVTIAQISEELRISTGNLTYHFKHKRNLIRAHITGYGEEIRKKLDNFALIANPRVFTEDWVDLLRLSLKYRFLFAGGQYIVHSDPVGAKQYEKTIEGVRTTFIRLTKELVKEGYLQPIKKPYSVEMLIDSIRWQWLGWLLLCPNEPIPNSREELRLIAAGILHMMFVCHHYIDAQFFKAVQTELKILTR